MMEDLVGLQLSDYLIEAPLGQGGMATVYRARHVGLGRECALKVLGPELARDQHFIERFNREARSAAHLDHPNIVPIYDMGLANGRYFIAMKLLPGDTLQKIGSQGPLPPKRLLVYLDQIADALDYAHAHGVIHRDIKPSNIIVTQFGQVTLTDFGIARRVDDPGVTMAGMLLGTPAYMAPEQVRGGETTPQTDIYQLGAMSYELLAGAPPFDGPTAQAVMAYHLQETPPPLHERRPDLGPAIDAVIQRAMAKQPEQRYSSAGEFVAAARNALEEPDVAAHIDPAVPLVAAAAAPLAGVAAMQPQEPAPSPPVAPPPDVIPAPEPAAPIGGGGGIGRPLLLGCGAVALLLLCVVAFGAAWWITRDDDDEPSNGEVAEQTAQSTPTSGSSATGVASATRAPNEPNDPTPTSPGAPVGSSPVVSDPTATLPNVPVPTPLSDSEPGATLETNGRLAYSGAITAAGQTIDFTFNSAGNQQFFMDVLEGETTNLEWTLLAPDGQTLPPSGTLSTVIGDSGPFELLVPGVYTIHVEAWDNTAIDSFRFQLWDVPPPTEQDIQQGAEAGGVLETPGVEDLYHFAGQAGQQVFVDVTAGENTSIQYEIVHETGMVVFNRGVMSTIIGDSGPLTLDLDGRYTLRVYPYMGATGAYAFKLWNVPPPQTFDIAIGQEVRGGQPGPGAGELETPGVHDVYRFQVEPGTVISMDVIEGESTDISWTLAHENGTVVINNYPMSEVIGDTDGIELTQGGVYILTVSGYQDATGVYAFMLTAP